LFKAFVAISYD